MCHPATLVLCGWRAKILRLVRFLSHEYPYPVRATALSCRKLPIELSRAAIGRAAHNIALQAYRAHCTSATGSTCTYNLALCQRMAVTIPMPFLPCSLLIGIHLLILSRQHRMLCWHSAGCQLFSSSESALLPPAQLRLGESQSTLLALPSCAPAEPPAGIVLARVHGAAVHTHTSNPCSSGPVAAGAMLRKNRSDTVLAQSSSCPLF